MFGVSRQAYYRSLRSQQRRKQTAEQVVQLVRQVRMEMPRLGGRKLYHVLQPALKELGVGRDRLFSILRANHLLIKPQRQYHVTTHSHHRFRKHSNLIEGIELTQPEQVWVADITYIGNQANPLYLSMVTDAYSKKIVGYNVSNSLATQGAISALRMATKNRKYHQHTLTHHSDRGLQYCSNEYQKSLQNSRIRCSMTQTYDPYANAIAERVNGIIKQEFLEGTQNLRLDLMKKLVKQTIKIYNCKRPHWSCWMNTPNAMHEQKKIKIRTYKRKSSIRNIPDTA